MKLSFNGAVSNACDQRNVIDIRNLQIFKGIRSLTLDFSHSGSKFEDLHCLDGFSTLATLRSLVLDFSQCELANMEGLHGLGGLTALQSLKLYFSRCPKLTSLDHLEDLAGLGALQCSQLTNVDGLREL